LRTAPTNQQSVINNQQRIDNQRSDELADRDLSDDELVELMVENPDLIQRPIVERGARAILARPAERLKEIM